MSTPIMQDPATGMIFANVSDTIQVGNATVNNAHIAAQLRNMARAGYIISVHFLATPIEIPNLGLSLVIPAMESREAVLNGQVRVVKINPMEINEIVGGQPNRTYVSGYDIAASIVNDYRTKAFSYDPTAHPGMLVSEVPNISAEQLQYLLNMQDRYAQAFIQTGDAKNAAGEAKYITPTFYAAVRWLGVTPKWAETAYTDNIKVPCWSCQTLISDQALVCGNCGIVQNQQKLDAALAARGIRKSGAVSDPVTTKVTETRSTDNAEVVALRTQLGALEKMIAELMATRTPVTTQKLEKVSPDTNTDVDTDTPPPLPVPNPVPSSIRPLKPANSK